MAELAEVEAGSDGLQIRWSDGQKSRYPWFWLRDHGHDEATLHPATLQRQLWTATVPDDVRAEAVTLVQASPSLRGGEADAAIQPPATKSESLRPARSEDLGAAGAVEIVWPGGVRSRYPSDFLWRFREPDHGEPMARRAPSLWTAATVRDALPRIGHDEVMADEEGLRRWLEQVEAMGFCLVEGVPPTPAATRALALRIGYLRQTIFGDFWDFTANLAKADTAYTDLELRPHTDGTYAIDAPGLQLFHCLEFEGEGGESTLVDGFEIASELAHHDPEAHATLAQVEVTGRYVGDGAHLMATRPVLRYEHGRLVQVTFNNYDRAPFRLPDDEMRAFYRALKAFEALANSERLLWTYPLRPGQVLLFDNWRVLHGRKAYDGRRRLCGCYLNREDFLSRLRLLRSGGSATS